MMSSIADGSTPDRRTTSGNTVVINVSGVVLTNVPLKERPIAVRAAPTMTGVGISRPRLSLSDFTKIADTVSLLVGDRRHLRLGHEEVLVTQPERFGRSVLRPRLDEVELAWRELQVRAIGVEQVAGHF